MRGVKTAFTIAAIVAAGAPVALGGGFNAYREGIDQFSTVPQEPYDVTFRPYFSSKTPWTGTVEVVGEDRNIPISGGEFADTLSPEVVHIYKFTRPDPYPQ
jgi:hypothetical protein